ncbi:hypothetical protein SRHO_G00287630 [Serrasalmus rhombeus]
MLTSRSAGVTALKEYEEAGSLKDSTRRLMVNIIVAHMCEKEGVGQQHGFSSCLLHLLTPQPAGRKQPKKTSIEEAIDHLVKFHKSCHSLEDHLMSTEGNSQPHLLAAGTSKA